MRAIAWLASAPVQELLEEITLEALCHSLAAERRAAETKKWEQSKVTHIATASRNMICVRFGKERLKKALKAAAAMRRLRRARRLTVGSLAWQEEAVVRPLRRGARAARGPTRPP